MSLLMLTCTPAELNPPKVHGMQLVTVLMAGLHVIAF